MAKPIQLGDIVMSNSRLAVHQAMVVTAIDEPTGYAMLHPLTGTVVSSDMRGRRVRLDRLSKPTQYVRLGNIEKFKDQ